MAFLPRSNGFGRWFGVTRETSGLTGNVFFSKRGFAGPYLYLHATEPTANSTSSLVDIEGLTTVTSITTASTSVSARGVGSVSSSSGVWTLTAPVPGVPKYLFATSTSTLVRQFTLASGNYEVGVFNSTANPTTAGSSFTTITLNGQGQAVTLMGISTAKYAVMALSGFSTGSQPFTTG